MRSIYEFDEGTLSEPRTPTEMVAEAQRVAEELCKLDNEQLRSRFVSIKQIYPVAASLVRDALKQRGRDPG